MADKLFLEVVDTLKVAREAIAQGRGGLGPIPVETITLLREGYGFRKATNRIRFYETLVDSFERHLK